jgi:hypothetical protein
VGIAVVGCAVGSADGSCVGAFVASVGAEVGLVVLSQTEASSGFVTKPSKHWHTHSSPALTAIVVAGSHSPAAYDPASMP